MRFFLGVLRFLRDYPQHQCRLCHRLCLDIAQPDCVFLPQYD